MSVFLYRLISGDEVIAKETSSTSDVIEIENAVSLVYHQVGEGRMSAGFAPFMPYSKGKITLHRRSISSHAEVKDDLLQEYNRVFSNIVIAPSGIL